MGTKIVGTSTAHCAILELLAKVAPTDAEVLINGPTGVGKELYARYLHDHSRRRKAPFIPVNCGSLANELLENVLFGHAGGAYTDAKTNSDGLVQAAEGGTFFLDEVDTLSIPCQIKLLRFLQDLEYRRLGETRIRKADIRIVAATNIDLIKVVDKGLFREDLFFRLRVIPIDIPRLAKRIKDIDVLVAKSIKDAAADYNLPPIKLS